MKSTQSCWVRKNLRAVPSVCHHLRSRAPTPELPTQRQLLHQGRQCQAPWRRHFRSTPTAMEPGSHTPITPLAAHADLRPPSLRIPERHGRVYNPVSFRLITEAMGARITEADINPAANAVLVPGEDVRKAAAPKDGPGTLDVHPFLRPALWTVLALQAGSSLALLIVACMASRGVIQSAYEAAALLASVAGGWECVCVWVCGVWVCGCA